MAIPALRWSVQADTVRARHCGVLFSIITAETVRKARERYGKGKPETREQMCSGLEHLNVTDARLMELGATGFMQALKVSYGDHEGGGAVKFMERDGTKWNSITDWIPSDQSIVRPMIEEFAGKYPKERVITPPITSIGGTSSGFRASI